jgi:polar amino acid transport system substrate-binding protein
MPNPAAQLAPTGKLRVAIAIAPSPSAQFAIKDDTGAYRGVAVILGQALAKKLGVPVELVVHNGSGEIQNSAADNKWDVAFLPVDEERKKFVDFGNAYHLLQSTYLVGPSAKIASVAAANSAGVRIGGVANTATFRTSNKTAPNATHVSFDKTDAAVAALKGGEVGRRACVLARVAHRAGAESAGLTHSRRRLFEFHHLGGVAQGQAGRARLCHRIHRGG